MRNVVQFSTLSTPHEHNIACALDTQLSREPKNLEHYGKFSSKAPKYNGKCAQVNEDCHLIKKKATISASILRPLRGPKSL